MKNKEYKKLGIKNYYVVSKDGIIQKGIDKKMKKFCRRLARRRLKRKSDVYEKYH